MLSQLGGSITQILKQVLDNKCRQPQPEMFEQQFLLMEDQKPENHTCICMPAMQ